MDPRLLAKHCWISGDPLVDDYGRWRADLIRVKILMLDGRHIDLTVIQEHLPQLELNSLWKLLIEAETLEYARTTLDTKSRQAHLMQLKLLCPPLGILGVEEFHGE